MPQPLQLDGTTILEPRAAVVWFTFPGKHHDIGRFHLRDGTFTGFYANVLRPVRCMDRLNWRIDDLYLDVWLGEDGSFRVLDRDELNSALAQQHISEADAAAAHKEAEQLERLWRQDMWPPEIVHEWTLERAQHVVRVRSLVR